MSRSNKGLGKNTENCNLEVSTQPATEALMVLRLHPCPTF